MIDPGTIISTLTSVYQAVKFIQQVAEDMNKFGDDKDKFDIRLNNAVVFLLEFQVMMFNENAPVGLIKSADLDPAFKAHVDDTIRRLAKDMSEYREAMKQYSDDDGGDDDGNKKKLKKAAKGELVAKDVHKEKKTPSRWVKEMKKSSSWVLFGKDSMIEVLQKIEDWTERLRQVLALAMQKDKWLKEQIRTGTFENGESAKRLGISLVAKRQRLLAVPRTEVWSPLYRESLDLRNLRKVGALVICRYIETLPDGTRSAFVVILEYKQFFPPVPADRKRIKSLVSTLQDSEFTDVIADTSQQWINDPDIKLNVLPCLGYIEEQRRAGIIYKLPDGVTEDSVITLHQILVQFNSPYANDDDIYSASLGDRFFLAYNFALTIANLHACGLVHKSICSKALLLIPPEPGRLSTEKSRAVPYLIGFGYARPASARTLLMPADDASEDFYRHPNRQGDRVLSFTKEYDIYAVGVVLLEIGVWRPLGDYRRISSAMTSSGEAIRKQLISVAKTELERAMGKRYTEAVLACLRTEFDVHDDDEARSKLALAFREKVLSALEAGINL